MTGVGTAQRVLTPSQFTTLARSLLEDSFPLVEIQGELSGFSRPGSGHLYFSLKDRQAQVRCAMFRPKSQWLKFNPADGDLVIARGRATLYEPRGDFQLVVEHLAPAGEGALRAAMEALIRQLDREGLFSAERKRPIPRWPQRIAVLTSPTGAVIHDVLSVIGRRMPLSEIDLLPVPVQGTAAAGQIHDMLQRADQSGRYAAILICRGGGSFEDLMAFNDEQLARAVFAARTPVIAAIGHETDTSIVELVADLRAPTPSAAAEALSHDRADVAARLRAQQRQLLNHLHGRLRTLAQRLDHAQMRLRRLHPSYRLAHHAERLQQLKLRLQRQPMTGLRLAHQRLQSVRHRLQALRPERRVATLRQRCDIASDRLQVAMARRLRLHAERLDSLRRTLHAVSPAATLGRGYAIVQGADGRVLSSAKGVTIGDRLTVALSDGTLRVEVSEIAQTSLSSR